MRALEFLLEYNIVNTSDLDTYVKKLAATVTFPEGKKWLTDRLKTFFINDENSVEPITTLDDKAPDWARKRLETGEPLHMFKPTAEAADRLGHVKDWLNSLHSYSARTTGIPQVARLAGMAVEQMRKLPKETLDTAFAKADEWFDQVNASANFEEPDPASVVTVFDVPGGRWVEIVSTAALGREGKLMDHCVGGGSYKVGRGSSTRIFSLRDPSNIPHVTVEVRREDGVFEIEQIKGRGNQAPVQRYVPAVRDFVERMRFELPDGGNGEVDIERMGLLVGDGKIGTVKEICNVVGTFGKSIEILARHDSDERRYFWDIRLGLLVEFALATYDGSSGSETVLTGANFNASGGDSEGIARLFAGYLNSLQPVPDAPASGTSSEENRNFNTDRLNYDPEENEWGTSRTHSRTVATHGDLVMTVMRSSRGHIEYRLNGPDALDGTISMNDGSIISLIVNDTEDPATDIVNAIATTLNAMNPVPQPPHRTVRQDFRRWVPRGLAYDPEQGRWGSPATLGTNIGTYQRWAVTRSKDLEGSNYTLAFTDENGQSILVGDRIFSGERCFVPITDATSDAGLAKTTFTAALTEFANSLDPVPKDNGGAFRKFGIWTHDGEWMKFDPVRLGLTDLGGGLWGYPAEGSSHEHYAAMRSIYDSSSKCLLRVDNTHILSASNVRFAPWGEISRQATQIAQWLNNTAAPPPARDTREDFKLGGLFNSTAKGWFTTKDAKLAFDSNGYSGRVVNSSIIVTGPGSKQVATFRKIPKGGGYGEIEFTRQNESTKIVQDALLAIGQWVTDKKIVLNWPPEHFLLLKGLWLRETNGVTTVAKVNDLYPTREIADYGSRTMLYQASVAFDPRHGLNKPATLESPAYTLRANGMVQMRIYTRDKVINKIIIRDADTMFPATDFSVDGYIKELDDLIKAEGLKVNVGYFMDTLKLRLTGDGLKSVSDDPRARAFAEGALRYKDGHAWLRGPDGEWKLTVPGPRGAPLAVIAVTISEGGLGAMRFLDPTARKQPRLYREYLNDFMDLIHDLNE